MSDAYFTDAEVDEMTDGLTQDAAKIRFLRNVCKLRVDRKPNGRPLAWRPTTQAQEVGQADASIVVDLTQWAVARKGRSGQKAQGR